MNGVLYFPSIEIRHMEWLYPALLYWDQVGIITPIDYINDPSLFKNEDIRILIQEGLIRQILPGNHLPDSNFQTTFLKYLDSIIDGLNIDDFKNPKQRDIIFKPMLIYDEKLTYEIAYQLVSKNLAIRRNGKYYVDEAFGYIYMAALATFLGMKENLQPLTDSPHHLRGFTSTVFKNVKKINYLSKYEENELVLKIFKDLLPVPASKISIDNLIQIKEYHSAQLTEFKQYIENFVADLDYLPRELHDYEIRRFLSETESKKEDIKQHLSRWSPNIGVASILATMGSVLPAVDSSSPITTTSATLCAAGFFASIWRERNKHNKHPLAYVINIEKQLFRQSRRPTGRYF